MAGVRRFAPALPPAAQFRLTRSDGLVQHLSLDHSVGPEMTEVLAQLAPGDDEPGRVGRPCRIASRSVEMSISDPGASARGLTPTLGTAMSGRMDSGTTAAIFATTSRAALASVLSALPATHCAPRMTASISSAVNMSGGMS